MASPRRIRVERAGDSPPAAEALAAVVRALEAWQPDAPLRFGGDPLRPMDPTVANLAGYLDAWRESARQARVLLFHLASAVRAPRVELFFDIEPLGNGDMAERVTVPLRGAPPGVAETVTTCAQAFGAYRGWVEDDALLAEYAAAGAERALATLPPELRQYMPDAGPARLPELLLPHEFDRRRAPDRVYWINLWTRASIDAVGRARVEAAGWWRGEQQPDGGMLLWATEEPTEPTDPAHLAALQGILAALDLRTAQERVRFA